MLGVNLVAARLPSILAALGILSLSVLTVRLWSSRAEALTSGMILALTGAQTRVKRFGANLFIGGTLMQMGTGLWFLATLSASQQDSFLQSPGAAAMFWGAVMAAFLALLIVHRYPALAAMATVVQTFSWT